MTTIEFSMPGSDQEPVRVTSEKLGRLAGRAAREEMSFRMYGTEFCRILGAVGMFQAVPRDFEQHSAVRCLARGDELVLAATNGVAAAIGRVPTDEAEGRGPLSIPHAQVKAVLGVFARPLPKGVSAAEYLLQVTVTTETIRIEDVSALFGGDTFTMVRPSEEAAERGDLSEMELVMNALSLHAAALDEAQDPIGLESGVFFSPAEVARVSRAAKAIGVEVHLRSSGRRLIAPLSESFIAYVAGDLHAWEQRKPPFIDERAVRGWRRRLTEVVDEGVL